MRFDLGNLILRSHDGVEFTVSHYCPCLSDDEDEESFLELNGIDVPNDLTIE